MQYSRRRKPWHMPADAARGLVADLERLLPRGKLIALILTLAVTVTGLSVAGNRTTAFFFSTTKNVTNEFVVGRLGTLGFAETEVLFDVSTNSFQKNTGVRVLANDQYVILPGVDMPKDPLVSFFHDSQSSVPVYVFLKLTPGSRWTPQQTGDIYEFACALGTNSAALHFSVRSEWSYLKEERGSYIYYRALSEEESLAAPEGSTGNVLEGDHIVVTEDFTAADLAGISLDSQTGYVTGMTLGFTAYAVQQSGFADAGAAWEAL